MESSFFSALLLFFEALIEILEQGSHEGLLASGGQYATLFNLQAQGYQ